MDGTLDDLAVFVAVARAGSFVQAARRTGTPTSTVSRSVARLEEALGVPLLRRTSRRVALTEEGRQLLAAAALHVDAAGAALAGLTERRATPSGPVRVTAPAYTGATWVARALAAFAATHPGITVELDATNAIHDLLADDFDFGVRVGGESSPDFVARLLWRGRLGLYAARSFVAEAPGGARVDRAAIERGPCVALRAGVPWRFVDPAGGVLEVRPNVRVAVNDPRAVVEVARQGLGIALVPRDAVPDDDPVLVPLEPSFGEPAGVDLFVVYPTRRLLPQRVRLAVDWLLATPPPGG